MKQTLLIIFCLLNIGWIHPNGYEKTVASVIAAEACGEGYHGMWAVANTIQNRAHRTGLSAYDVVMQPSQYHGLTSKHRQKLYKECQTQADYLAKHILEIKDITDGAIYFNTCHTTRWAGKLTVKIKHHCFYRAKE